MAQMKHSVIFIVEGSTDKKALDNIFKKIYRNKNVSFQFTHGDITSDNNISVDKMEDEIYKYVEKYRKEKKLKITDIWQIVHIFDMDGAYIPRENIIKNNTKEFIYSTTDIKYEDTERVIERNEQKKEKMNYLLSLNEINHIPYICYFMSSNLDYALYNLMNLDDNEKKIMLRNSMNFF